MTVKPRAPSVCLLGGTGFVGRSLLNHLVRRGYSVRVPTRSRVRNRDLLVFPGVELISADVHDERALIRLLNEADAVVNLVGILNEHRRDGSDFRRVHVDLVAKLLRACQETGTTRLLHVSALKANAERGASRFLRTKGQAEQLIRSESGDIRYTLFRPSVIFGPGDAFTTRLARLLRWLPVLPLPCADARLSPVFVGDVSRALLTALDDSHTHGRSYELCGPDIYSLEDVVRLIQRQLGVRRAVLGLPHPLGRMQAWLSEHLLPGRPFTTDNFRTLSVAGVCTENGLISLGIEPRSLAAVVPGYLEPPGRAQRPPAGFHSGVL